MAQNALDQSHRKTCKISRNNYIPYEVYYVHVPGHL